MAEPLVSVVIPVYAGERFLARALRSVTAQTYLRHETIVVDDASPDASVQIARGHGGVRGLSVPRGGVAAARNAGVRAARGQLVAFLDQDDEWDPRKLELQVGLIAARPDIDLVFTHLIAALEERTPRPPWVHASWLTEPQPGFIPSTWLVRRSALERVGPFDAAYEIASDGDWLARFKDHGLRPAMLPQSLVRWRLHGANGSYDQDTMRRELVTVMRTSVRRARARS